MSASAVHSQSYAMASGDNSGLCDNLSFCLQKKKGDQIMGPTWKEMIEIKGKIKMVRKPKKAGFRGTDL